MWIHCNCINATNNRTPWQRNAFNFLPKFWRHNTDSSTMHSLINSASENGLFFLAILCAITKLAFVAFLWTEEVLTNTFSCRFKLLRSSAAFFCSSWLDKPFPKSVCLVWKWRFKMYSSNYYWVSLQIRHIALLPTSVKMYFSVHENTALAFYFSFLG